MKNKIISFFVVKLPDLLQLTDIPHKKLKVLLKYLDMFLRYNIYLFIFYNISL